MIDSMKFLLFLTLTFTFLVQGQSQTGLHCLRCFSGVCGTNITSEQLTALINDSDLDCCKCFNCLTFNFTVSDIENQYSRESLETCCSEINTVVTTQSYTLDTDLSPTFVYRTTNNLQAAMLPQDNIGPGDYIIPHFQFNSDACIRTVFVRPMSPISPGGNNQLSLSIYRRYSSPDFNSELFELQNSFSVNLVQEELLNNVAAGTLDVPNSICVTNDNFLGFSISPTADFSIGRETVTDIFTHNITAALLEQPCQELEGFFEVVPLNGFGFLQFYDPLITFEFGEPDTEGTQPTTNPSTVPTNSESTPQDTATTPLLTESTQPPAVAPLPEAVIIAIGAGGGVCVLLLLVIVILIVCLCVRRSRRRSTHTLNTKGNSTVNTLKSPRKQDLSTNNTPDVITVHNVQVEDSHDYYDTPAAEVPHHYHELEPGVLTGRLLAATGQPMPSHDNIGVVYYDNPRELSSTPLDLLAQNPFYRTLEEANEEKMFYNPPGHYHVPTALIRAQQTPPPGPFYHELEQPGEKKSVGNSSDTNIYTETAFGLSRMDLRTNDSIFSSKRSDRSGSVDTNLTVDTKDSDTPLLPHYYHELENKGSPSLPPRPLLTMKGEGEQMRNSRTDSLERSTGSHHVYEPGIYVPGLEERQHLGVVAYTDQSEEYKSWKQKSYKSIKSKKQFFEETITYWEPKDAEQDIYDQFSKKKFREILKDQIEFSSHLGVGQFGSVSKATWLNLQGGSRNVAVKTLKPTIKQDAKIAFLKEAAIMGQFNHSNVVRLYGVVTMSEPIMIVMELLALGDLDTYLYNNYRPGEMPPPHQNTLLSFSRQVACGMKYLARKNFVHRDLAARNVLVNETLVCKIADFGMSRNLKDTNYYSSRGGTVPIKWTAPEGLNYKKFSTASDVYSYGMVLYEIWSLGLKPLSHIKIQNVSQFVTEGYCQHPPPGCPRKIYEIMVNCWAPEQSDRPTFPAIFDVLNGPDTDLLKWSDEDVTKLSSLAMKLGAPLSEGKKMFPDLQHKNLVNEDHHSFLGTDV